LSTLAAPTFAQFLRFIQGDDLGLVLRSHLALEYCLNLTIKKASPRGVGELDRLPFMAKVDVCSLVKALPATYRPMWVAANRVRNRFAHDLHASITQRDADDFLATIPRIYFDLQPAAVSRLLASAQTPRHQVALCFFILFTAALSAAGIARDAATLEGLHELRDEIGAVEVDGRWVLPTRMEHSADSSGE